MKLLSFGSLNLDQVYRVRQFARPGESVRALETQIFCGGKGLNLSIAAAAAGCEVWHAGKVGPDGAVLIERLIRSGVDTTLISTGGTVSGHAIIQVNDEGENKILIAPGANGEITPQECEAAVRRFSAGDWLALQNETSCLPELLRLGKEQGMTIALIPSPVDGELEAADLSAVSYFILSRYDGSALTGKQAPDEICGELLRRCPEAHVVLNMGAAGSLYCTARQTLHQHAYPSQVVDPTGAGDIFAGYFIARMAAGEKPERALRSAAKAAALSTAHMGACEYVPTPQEVENAYRL